MQFDKEIEMFNYDTQKSRTLSEAEAYRRGAKNVMTAGYANAFTGLLKGAYEGNKEFGWLGAKGDKGEKK